MEDEKKRRRMKEARGGVGFISDCAPRIHHLLA